MPVRILIADDHDGFRRGLRAFLQQYPDWQVAGEAMDGQDAIDKAKQLRPDIVLLDITMPQLNGIEASRKIRSAIPETEILIVSERDTRETVRQAVDAGARGYVLKSDAGRELAPAVQAMSQHRSYFSSRVSRHVGPDFPPDHPHARNNIH